MHKIPGEKAEGIAYPAPITLVIRYWSSERHIYLTALNIILRKMSGPIKNSCGEADFMVMNKEKGTPLKKEGGGGKMSKAMKNVDIDDDAFKSIEAIIQSMTPLERETPKLLNGSRRKRIGFLSSGEHLLSEVKSLRTFVLYSIRILIIDESFYTRREKGFTTVGRRSDGKNGFV